MDSGSRLIRPPSSPQRPVSDHRNVCPACRNREFEPTPDVPRPVENVGGKRHLSHSKGSMATRRYVCMQCGHRWVTLEKWYYDIGDEPELELKDRKAAA